MKIDRFVKLLLLVIVIFLGIIALRPYVAPPAVDAQSTAAHTLYIEPGPAILYTPDGTHNVEGKMVIDLRNGNVWGFPQFWTDPHPIGASSTALPISHPFLMGKLALADMDK
jgi:hypothetical protein